MKRVFANPSLYHPPGEGDNPPHWIRGVLLATCGGVSFAHGSNDGQKGMGLILLALIGFLPTYYSLNVNDAGLADGPAHGGHRDRSRSSSRIAQTVAATVRPDMQVIVDVARRENRRWPMFHPPSVGRSAKRSSASSDTLSESNLTPETHQALLAAHRKEFTRAIEYVPLWVVVGVALALGIGTTIGYKRIVVTVAEKIGKTHLTYAQGAAAEIVAAATIGLADVFHLPVSTTHVLSSGVAGTMWANRSGVQLGTVKRIGMAWILTLPCAILLSAALFTLGGRLIPGAAPDQTAVASPAGEEVTLSADPKP